MTNPFGKAETFVKELGHDIEVGALDIFGKAAVDKFKAEFAQLLEADVKIIFTDAIQAFSSLELTGAQKQVGAFAQIQADLVKLGKSFSTSLINFGIEMFVNLLKAKAA